MLKAAGEYADIASTISVASSSSIVEETPITRESVWELFRIARAAYSTESWPKAVYAGYIQKALPFSDNIDVQQAIMLLTEKSRGKYDSICDINVWLENANQLFSKNKQQEGVQWYVQAIRSAIKSGESTLPWNTNIVSWVGKADVIPGLMLDEYYDRTQMKMITQFMAECHLLGMGTPQNLDLAVMFAEQSHILFTDIKAPKTKHDDSSSDSDD